MFSKSSKNDLFEKKHKHSIEFETGKTYSPGLQNIII